MGSRAMQATKPGSRGWRSALAPFAPAVVLGGCLAYAFADLLFRGRSSLQGDNLTGFVTRDFRLAELLQPGGWTFWQHDDAFGFPRYAEATGAWFHPVNLVLLRVLPWLRAHDLLLVLSFAILAGAAYAFARALRLERAYAVATAMLVTFSPGALALASNSVWAESVAWSAVVFALFERWYERARERSILPLAIGIALLLLAGYPPTALATVLFLGLTILFRGLFERGAPAKLIALAAAAAIGVCLAGIQILPLVELIGQSPRQDSIRVLASMPIVASFRGLFLSSDPSLYVSARDIGPGLGSMVSLVACMSIPAVRDRRAISYLLAIAVFVPLAAGPGSMIFELCRHVVPGLSRLRLTLQFVWVTLLPAAACVCMILRDATSRPHRRTVWLACLASGAAILALAWQASASIVAKPFLRNVDLAIFAAVVVCIATAARRGRAPWFAPVLCAIVLLDTLAVKAGYLHFFDGGLLMRDRGAADFLARAQRDDPTSRTAHYVTSGYTRRFQQQLFEHGSEPDYAEQIAYCARMLCPSLNLLDHVRFLEANDSLPLARQKAVEKLVQAELRGEGSLAPGARFIDRFRVRFVIFPDAREPQPIAPDFRTVYQDPAKSPTLLENPSVRGATDWVRDVQRVADQEAATRAVLAQSADLVVEERPVRELPRALERLARALPWAHADPPVRIATDHAEPGTLFVAIPPYPGWRATVDGQPASLLPAQLLGQAVALPAGAHDVELVYRPYAFDLGALLSLATAAAVGLAWAVQRRRSGESRNAAQ